MKKRTTHKIITNAVHIACLVAAAYIFDTWRAEAGIIMDAPQMLQYVAWVEIVNLSQYSAKSAYDHKHGIFDGTGTQTASQAMQSNDLSQAGTVEQAMKAEQSDDASAPPTDANNNMAG